MFRPEQFLAVTKRLEKLVALVCRAIEPELIPLSLVDAVDASLGRMETLIGGVRLRLRRRIEETAEFRGSSAATVADYMADRNGTTRGSEQAKCKTSEKLKDLPLVDEAVRDGELSTQKAEAVADAASASPGAERQLVTAAKRKSLRETRQRCDEEKARADRDGDARRQRLHRERFVRRRGCGDGAEEVITHGPREVIARFWAVLSGFATSAFDQARQEGRHETSEQYAFDGLVAMAEAAAGATTNQPAPAAEPEATQPSFDDTPDEPAEAELAEPAEPAKKPRSPIPSTVLLRLDIGAAIRGYPADDEVCEIPGFGSVPVSFARDLVESDNPFNAVVMTKGVDVVGVAHLGRNPTAAQTTALLWRDPTCQVEGCDRMVGLERDHEADWADTHVTYVPWMSLKCPHHHDLKTTKGWRMVPGTGKRPMVPPGHPDHPGDDPRQYLPPTPGPAPPPPGDPPDRDPSLFDETAV